MTYYTGDSLDNLDDEGLQALTDAQIGSIAYSAIYDATLMTGTRYADKFHDRCDRIYDECARRSRGIYQRAWNATVRDEGHTHMVQEVNPTGP